MRSEAVGPESAVAGERAALEIHLQGPLEVWVHGSPVEGLGERRADELLARLVLQQLEGGGALGNRTLAGELWPDEPEDKALRNLRNSVRELRKALGNEARRLPPAEVRSRTLSLELEGAWVDLSDFDRHARPGDADLPRRAAAFYRGQLLEGVTAPWLSRYRQERDERYASVLLAHVEILLEVEHSTLAIECLRLGAHWLLHPETVHRRLMEVLAKGGCYTEALAVYRALAERLRQESARRACDDQPEPETQQLYERLREESSRSGAAPAALPAAPVPRRALVPLVGRAGEVPRLREVLRQHPLLTLVGEGGAGKTLLAEHLAEACVAEYVDGVLALPLAGLRTAEELEQQLATGLRVSPGCPSLRQAVLNALRYRKFLLVLDNCEHLVEPCVELVRTLLAERSCADLRILATSQQPLGLAWERCDEVSRLSLPPRGVSVDPAAVLESPAAQLFVERAREVNPEFTVSGTAATRIAELCHWLEGNPLQIEWVAAHAKLLTVDQMRNQLPHLLEDDRRDRPERQKSFARRMAWSYALLSKPERVLFRRLAVFQDGWALPAAEEACSGDGLDRMEILRNLNRLAGKYLLRVDTTHPVAWYHLHETRRSYGWELLLDHGEEDRVRDQHLEYYRAWATRVGVRLAGPEDLAMVREVEREQNNVRAAMRWALEQRRAEAALQLASGLWRFWLIRGYLEEGQRHLRAALDVSPELGAETAARAEALLGLGCLTARRGDMASGLRLQTESLRIWRRLGDRRGTAACLRYLGMHAWSRREFEESQAHYQESLTLTAPWGTPEERWAAAGAYFALALLEWRRCDYPRAREWLGRALLIQEAVYAEQRIGLRALGFSLELQGFLSRAAGNPDEARRSFQRSLALSQELGDRTRGGELLEALGDLACARGSYGEAGELLRRSLALATETRETPRVISARHYLALLALAQNDESTADLILVECIQFYQHAQDHAGLAWALEGRGRVAALRGDGNLARSRWRESLEIRRRLQDRRGMLECLEDLGTLMYREGARCEGARLMGAVAAARERLGLHWRSSPSVPEEYHQLAQDRCRLPANAPLAAAWDAGSHLTLEEAADEALLAWR